MITECLRIVEAKAPRQIQNKSSSQKWKGKSVKISTSTEVGPTESKGTTKVTSPKGEAPSPEGASNKRKFVLEALVELMKLKVELL